MVAEGSHMNGIDRCDDDAGTGVLYKQFSLLRLFYYVMRARGGSVFYDFHLSARLFGW